MYWRSFIAVVLGFALSGVGGVDSAVAGSPPVHTRPYTVKCAATVNVWVELDNTSIPTREPTNIELKKRVQFHLIGSAPYRGDAVLCNYGTRKRDVATSYTVRCLQPRKERGYRHSYFCH